MPPATAKAASLAWLGSAWAWVFRLRLDECQSHGLRLGPALDAQGVVDAPFGLLEGFAVADLDGPGGLLTPDEILGPAPRVDGWLNQLRARV